jgi:hypothetical protein
MVGFHWRVKDPKRVAAWYTDHKMLELVGSREDIGTKALGSSEYGPAVILIPGDQLERPDLLQLHLHVMDVDAEYERLKSEGVKFEEPPKKQALGLATCLYPPSSRSYVRTMLSASRSVF